MIDKIRPRKLNATSDSRLRKADEMQDALNLVSSNDFRASGDTTEGNDGTGNSGVLKPTRGTFEVPAFNGDNIPVDCKKRVLGSVTDHTHNVVYFFVWCSKAIYQGVYAYDPTGFLPGATVGEEEYRKVFTHALFKFPSDGFIKADIIHVNKPFGDAYDSQPVLYFTDNTNEPRKLHPFRALTENFESYTVIDYKDFITACPKTPVFPITAVFERDPSDSTSSFEGLPGFQFAYQHIYKGGEESALSTFSDIAVPQAYFQQGSSNAADLYANNKCVLTIPSNISYNDQTEVEQILRTKEVAEVRILRRVGNTGAWAVIDEVPVEELEENGNKYNFYNRSIAGGFSTQTAIKPYDNLPQIAQTQAVVSDRLVYGNYVEGYDNVKIRAAATVTYLDRPGDFKELEVKIIPTLRHIGPQLEGAGQRNKRAGYYIDTTAFPGYIEEGTIINMEFSVRPNRNFHIYNSDNSFHGSRHLSISDPETTGDGQDEGNNISLVYPEVYGLEQTEWNARGGATTNENLNIMWGKNAGVGLPELTWEITASQQNDILNQAPSDVVFGTSAANPFILRGNSLHFSCKVYTKTAVTVGAAALLRTVITRLLSQPIEELDEDEDLNDLLNDSQQEIFNVLEVNNTSHYLIDENIDGGGSFTTQETSISSAHEIPVSSGGDDRKHLIVSLGDASVVNEGADNNSLEHLSPCGYFIVNKARVAFGLIAQNDDYASGFLELDLKELKDLEVLTAIPFMDAERWRDDAFEANADGCNPDDAGTNDSRNWGLRDATLWSLDSLIVDSWFCYSRAFMQSGNFHPKVFTPIATDFPRYMNGSDTEETGLEPGDLNPNVTNDGIGKNAAILNIGDDWNKFIGDTSAEGAFIINPMYKFRWNNPILEGLVKPFVQSHLMPYLQTVAVDDLYQERASMAEKWKNGRHMMLGFLRGSENDELLKLERYSLVDGAIGPGSSTDGGENIRKIMGGGTNYAVGSVTGEMIFTGRLAPRGYFRPEKLKQGKRQYHLGGFLKGFDNLFHQYGQGPVLPHLGGVGYQHYKNPDLAGAEGSASGLGDFDDPFQVRSIGFIHNWYLAGNGYCGGDVDDNNDLDHESASGDYLNTYNYSNNPYMNLSSRYMGDETHEEEWQIVSSENDLKASARIKDAELGITGREFSIFGGKEWEAGGRSFKTRANHSFGIVYYDERGRSGKVNPITFIKVTQGGDSESKGNVDSIGVYIPGYSPSERGGNTTKNGRVSITIELSGVTPPDWAHHFQVVYGGNTTKGNFIQYSTGGAFVASKNISEVGSEEGEDLSSTNIYVSLNYLQGNKDVSYAEAFGAVSPLGTKDLYVYKPGDKLRVLAYYKREGARVWVEDVEFDIIGVEQVTNNPNENIFRRAFELNEDSNVVADCRTGQFLVLKNNVRAEGFHYSSVKAGGNKDQTQAHLWNNICTVEIYSPSKQIDEENRLFYETGKVGSIRKDAETGVLHHHFLADPDAVLDGANDAITLTKGDVRFKPVALAVAEFGKESRDNDGNTLGSYLKFKNLIRKGVKDGESSPRFKNYYVESMTFNDSFAGNNVIGRGKPNTVDKDISQIRKPSSVIYSDKQNFAKRKLSFPSFNGTAYNWKDLPGEFGGINYLLNNYDSLICIQENKSSTIPVERNIISDASGSNTLITSNKVIGVQAFFAGEYGCDNNPESVVKTDAATYFASKAKSEVYRLTGQGVQVISKEGMASYFFRIFEEVKKAQLDGEGRVYIPGGYDPLKDEFLITVSNLTQIDTEGSVYLPQGDWGDNTVLVEGCMVSTALNYNPLANVSDDSCLYYVPTGCMDPCSTTFDRNAEESDGSCLYFDLNSFDHFSNNPIGGGTNYQRGLNIDWCYSNVPSPNSSSDWPGFTALEIKKLGWDFEWIRQQETVSAGYNESLIGYGNSPGTFCMTPGGEQIPIPMGVWLNSAYWLDKPHHGWSVAGGLDRAVFAKAILQQISGDPLVSAFNNNDSSVLNEVLPPAPIYGCMDTTNNNYNSTANAPMGDRPDLWVSIQTAYEEMLPEEDIPWESFPCGEDSLAL